MKPLPSASIVKEADDESERLAALRRGDAGAQEWLVESHRQRLYRTAVHFLGWQDPEAEDAVQETFVAAFRAMASFRGDSKLYTWLNQICVRHCFRRLRQRRRVMLGAAEDLAATLSLPSAGPDALHQVLAGESRGLLKRALTQIRARCRELIERRDLRGQAYAQAAAELKLPLGTFMSRLARCREELRLKVEALL